jgi:acyl-homoserine lactone acylase PvdQ
MRRWLIAVTVLIAAVFAASGSAAASDLAFNILPPGQFGGLPLTSHSTDQLPLYDGLTPFRGKVTTNDIRRLYKPENFRPTGATRTEDTGRPGLTILRDSFGVPHIYGRTRADAWFGTGFVTAEDRGLLLALGRGPARAAVADVPGLNAFGLVTSGRSFVPSAQSEALVTAQRAKLVQAYGRKGREILDDLAAYADGVTAYFRKSGSSQPPWTVNDAIAVTAFIGSIFGNGGGNEVRNSQFLARLRDQLGVRRGSGAFVDLMEADDRDAPTTTQRRFRYGRSSGSPTQGSPLVDPGSIQNLDPTQPQPLASNFLVVSPGRSATHEPLAVMGPQLGYFYPEILLEADLHAPGLLSQGTLVPGGGPYVLIGRTPNYAWSLTSATNDNRDQFLEQLCEPDGSTPTRASRHYVYRGRCRAMTPFDAGTLDGKPVRYPVTVHGPVSGTATVGGKPYAIVRQRSTYAQDGLSLAALHDMTLGRGHNVPGFFRSANEFGFTFNWAYASRHHTAYFSSGLLPRRAPGLNKLLPTLGTGHYDWRGFISLRQHPHDVGGPGGLFLNWNNRPAPGWQPGDDNHSYGSVHRVQMFNPFPRRVRIQDVVSNMNRAATQDLRATQVWPDIRAVLRGGPAPDALTAQAADLVTAWSRKGASRLDANLDGKIDDPGAAVMDAAWNRIADAVMRPVLGPLTLELASLQPPDNPPYRANGSSFSGGWYGYVDKDLRTLLGVRVKQRYHLRYCGSGSLSACRAALWAALKAASDQLAATQGPDPAAWRSDATLERIRFSPGLIPNTMRWTNRPTFQQVLRFGRFPFGHRNGGP